VLDEGREATAARLVFEHELRSTLRDFPWAFATSYVTPTFLAGTSDAPVNNDWVYTYRLPESTLFVRRLVTEKGRGYDPAPERYRLAEDDGGKVLYTNRLDPVVEVTTRPDGAVKIADDVFGDAFAWRLAAALALSVAPADPATPEQLGRGPDQVPKAPSGAALAARQTTAQWAWGMYQAALRHARTVVAQVQQQDPTDGDAGWITGRN
jgi:hypothetical protein